MLISSIFIGKVLNIFHAQVWFSGLTFDFFWRTFQIYLKNGRLVLQANNKLCWFSIEKSSEYINHFLIYGIHWHFFGSLLMESFFLIFLTINNQTWQQSNCVSITGVRMFLANFTEFLSRHRSYIKNSGKNWKPIFSLSSILVVDVIKWNTSSVRVKLKQILKYECFWKKILKFQWR